MTYDFTATVQDMTLAQAKLLFDALVLLLAPYPDSTAGYNATTPDGMTVDGLWEYMREMCNEVKQPTISHIYTIAEFANRLIAQDKANE